MQVRVMYTDIHYTNLFFKQNIVVKCIYYML